MSTNKPLFDKYSIMSGVERKNLRRLFDDALLYGIRAHIIIDWDRTKPSVSARIADDVALREEDGSWSVSPDGFRSLRNAAIDFEHRQRSGL